ncbi:hypothetical protein PZE06_18825 [Robertmurraya sp. DFI.2.37]|uniref:hypothetical protein n=1 Tax=Robertmurraya sp. DFI.2.37 TaxID=3031819 RepID=UPI0023DB5F1C|nr:hypothetical protein [Robertmurraya sp. DFI.2.37]MDF1510192.1 hypothetical protein [Robertmurraya sp. DFI.2.37]
MAKKFYEVIEVESGQAVDFIILDKMQDPERVAILMDLGDKYELQRVTKSDGLVDKLTDWYNLYRKEVVVKEFLGNVSVDSGMLMIADPCYVKESLEDKCEEIGELIDNEARSGQVLNGFCLGFSPGYGDGLYDVFAKRDENGRIIKVEIIME